MNPINEHPDLKDAGLKVEQVKQTGVYERFIRGEAEYPIRVFIGIKQT